MQQAERITPTNDTSAQQQPQITLRGKPINPWLVLLSLIFGFFMSLLDATIVNIALPSIQSNLKTDLTTVSWTLNAYNLVFAVLLVTAGRLADQFGRKRLFMIGMIVFSVGSLFCAMSENFASLFGYPAINWLIGSRAFQAIGAASLNSVSLAIITAVFPRERRGAAIGLWGALAGLAAAVGPVLGGFLVQNFDWRWIFFVNLPFCIVGLFMVAFFVPETRNPGTSKRVDILGMITLSASLLCLILAIIEGNDWGWSSVPILSLFGGAVVALVMFIVAELFQREPIIDFSLFRSLTFSVSNVGIFLFSVALQGAFLILVLYFINAQGYTQLDAAYAVIPIPLASFVVSAAAGALSRKFNHPRLLAVVGLIVLAIGFVTLYTLNKDSNYLDTTWRGIIIGIGMGLAFLSFPNIVLSDVPSSKYGVGSGVFNTFRQFGFTLGVAIMISIFTGQLSTNIPQARDNSIAIVKADTVLPAQLKEGIVAGLQKSGTSTSQGQANRQDLTKLADRLPPQVPAQQKAKIRDDLAKLNTSITDEYKTAVVNAFRSAWLISAIVAVVAACVSFFARPRRRVATTGQRQEDASEEQASVSIAH